MLAARRDQDDVTDVTFSHAASMAKIVDLHAPLSSTPPSAAETADHRQGLRLPPLTKAVEIWARPVSNHHRWPEYQLAIRYLKSDDGLPVDQTYCLKKGLFPN